MEVVRSAVVTVAVGGDELAHPGDRRPPLAEQLLLVAARRMRDCEELDVRRPERREAASCAIPPKAMIACSSRPVAAS
jgi:hypothetical protein